MNDIQHNDIQFFFCYDSKLFTYLNERGFRFVTKARHCKTNDLFSLYIKTLELKAAIDQWEASAPNK